jgi:hypothetical protein
MNGQLQTTEHKTIDIGYIPEKVTGHLSNYNEYSLD